MPAGDLLHFGQSRRFPFSRRTLRPDGARGGRKNDLGRYTDRQRGRLQIKPGITGWAQVNGRTSLPWSERIELDLFYIAHRSLPLDLRILRRTVAIVLGGSGLYKGQAGGWVRPAGDSPTPADRATVMRLARGDAQRD